MSRRRLKLFLVLAPCLFCRQSRAQDLAPFQAAAEKIMAAYGARDDGALRPSFDPEMSKALPPEKLEAFFTGLRRDCGALERLEPARPLPPGALVAAHFDRCFEDIKVNLDASGRIAGFWIATHAPDLPVPARNAAPLSLPFKGRWLVYWGGDTRELNYHVDFRPQRFAFDIVGVDAAGRTKKEPGSSNEDYAAFGREILAPADGVVVEAIDGVRDNAPGSMNPYSALGNAVLIQHGPQEVSVMAHLKNGSVRVAAGDKIKRGQVVGLCGNSGNSSEPHLHYHLQNTPVSQDATGIKVFFTRVLVDERGRMEPKRDYSPVKGDVISAP